MTASVLMTKNVFSISEDDSIIKAAQVMFDHNWDGLPVVNSDLVLVGIITQYDLVTKGANIHLPTFVQLMGHLSVYQKDPANLKPELERIVTMKVKDLMNGDPMTVSEDTSLEDVSKIFAEHHRVNPIPVVDASKRLVGIISRFDLIKLYTGTMSTADAIIRENSVEKKVDIFVEGFGKNTLLVSKFQPLFWKIMSFFFIIVGIVIAMALIIRIQLNT